MVPCYRDSWYDCCHPSNQSCARRPLVNNLRVPRPTQNTGHFLNAATLQKEWVRENWPPERHTSLLPEPPSSIQPSGHSLSSVMDESLSDRTAFWSNSREKGWVAALSSHLCHRHYHHFLKTSDRDSSQHCGFAVAPWQFQASLCSYACFLGCCCVGLSPHSPATSQNGHFSFHNPQLSHYLGPSVFSLTQVDVVT